MADFRTLVNQATLAPLVQTKPTSEVIRVIFPGMQSGLLPQSAGLMPSQEASEIPTLDMEGNLVPGSAPMPSSAPMPKAGSKGMVVGAGFLLVMWLMSQAKKK